MDELSVHVEPVPTGVPLKHLLPPTACPDDMGSCPAVICGRIPPSSPLHIAIGHNMSEQARQAFKREGDSWHDIRKHGSLEIVDDERDLLNHTWIITSSRMRFHGRLLDENERFLRRYGGHPMVNDALNRTEIRGCATSEECLLLLHLLHGRRRATQEFNEGCGSDPAAADSMAFEPTLIVLHDLLGLVLDREVEDGRSNDRQQRDEGVDLDDAVTPSARAQLEVYMQLLAAFSSMVDQVSERRPATLILEPSLLNNELRLMPGATNTKGEAGRGAKVATVGLLPKAALQWMFGRDQVWDMTEVESGRYEMTSGSGDGTVATCAKTMTDEGESVYRWSM